MNRKYILIGLLVCITGIFSGCHSWLDVQPEDQVTDGQLFSTESGFRTALNGIYVELSNNALYGGELSVDAVEILAQRYDFSGNTTNAYRLGTYNYTIDYAKSKFAAVWEKAYSLIANCNKLLEYAEKNEEVLTGKMRKMIIGEAMHFVLFCILICYVCLDRYMLPIKPICLFLIIRYIQFRQPPFYRLLRLWRKY